MDKKEQLSENDLGKTSKKKACDSSMSKDDLHEVVAKALDHENVAKIVGIVDKYIDQAQSKKKRKSFINMIYIVAALFGFYLAWDATMNQITAGRINEDIKVQKAEIKKITQAIMNVRKVRYLIVLRCKYGHSYTPYEQDKIRFLARYDLAEAMTGVRFDFSEEVQQKLYEFTQFDESVRDVCSNDSPPDSDWRQRMHKIEDSLGKDLNKSRERLNHI